VQGKITRTPAHFLLSFSACALPLPFLPPPTAGAAIIRRNKISPIRVPLSRGYAGSEARHIRYRGRLSQLSYREEIDRRRTHATSRRRRRRDIARTFAQGT